MEKVESFQQKVMGKLDSHRQKNDTGSLFHTAHKNQLEMDQKSNVDVKPKIFGKEHRKKLIKIGHSNDFLHSTSKVQVTKS